MNPRKWSNREIKNIVNLPLLNKTVLNLSGWDDSDKEGKQYREYFTGSKSYSISRYQKDNVRSVDGCTLIIDLENIETSDLSETFDIVFTHTVLEHVYDLKSAFKIMRILSNKYIVGVVPMVNVVHWEVNSYQDYWRFTPHGVNKCLEDIDYELIHLKVGPKTDLYQYIVFVGIKKGLTQEGEFQNLIVEEFESGEVGLISFRKLLFVIFVRIMIRLRLLN
jgi:hypothetical protein